MAELFISVPGTITAFEMPATVGQVSIPAEIMDPKLIPTRPAPIIFGSMEWKQATHQQFSNSLDGSVYIYVFGDQMGTVVMSGFAFDRMCDKEDSGLKQVLDYYKGNRASQRSSPIQISIAGQIVQGFLTSASVRAVGVAMDPGPVLHQYTLEINALP